LLSLLLDIVRRYSLSGRQRRFTRFVAIASTLGMVVGVASLIVVLSVMNGFSRELHQRILSVVAHAYVTPVAGSVDQWRPLADQLLQHPEVAAAVPFIDATALLRSGSRTQGVRLTGVDPVRHTEVSQVADRMVEGAWQTLEAPGFGVVLGRSLAAMLGVGVGDPVEVIMPSLSVTPMGTFPRRRSLTVVGLFSVGADPDAQQAFVSLDSASKLTGRRGVDGVQLRMNDLMAADRVALDLRSEVGADYAVLDWSQTQGSLFAAVRMEKVTVAVLLLSVIAVAAFNIVSTLTMSVTEKRSDIAVLRVLGFSAMAIMGLFIGYGMTLGVVGIAIGGLLGVLLALRINTLLDALQSMFGFQLFDPTVYYIGSLPSELQWADVWVTLLAALLLSLLATLYPAYKAAKIPAAEALRRD
jgi:lipoprotein-releasing system permease protein